MPGGDYAASVQAAIGNGLVFEALAGADLDGLGAVVAGDMALAAGGVEIGDFGVSNQAMLTAMRHGADVVDWSHPAVRQLRTGGGQALPGGQRARMESAFGHDFSHVRVHVDSQSAQAATALNAHAFAIGADIFFGPGEWSPGSDRTDRLLAHELTHVVQHDEGRLPSGDGVSSPTDATEQEAYGNEDRILGQLSSIDAEISRGDHEPADLLPAGMATAPEAEAGAPEGGASVESASGPVMARTSAAPWEGDESERAEDRARVAPAGDEIFVQDEESTAGGGAAGGAAAGAAAGAASGGTATDGPSGGSSSSGTSSGGTSSSETSSGGTSSGGTEAGGTAGGDRAVDEEARAGRRPDTPEDLERIRGEGRDVDPAAREGRRPEEPEDLRRIRENGREVDPEARDGRRPETPEDLARIEEQGREVDEEGREGRRPEEPEDLKRIKAAGREVDPEAREGRRPEEPEDLTRIKEGGRDVDPEGRTRDLVTAEDALALAERTRGEIPKAVKSKASGGGGGGGGGGARTTGGGGGVSARVVEEMWKDHSGYTLEEQQAANAGIVAGVRARAEDVQGAISERRAATGQEIEGSASSAIGSVQSAVASSLGQLRASFAAARATVAAGAASALARVESTRASSLASIDATEQASKQALAQAVEAETARLTELAAAATEAMLAALDTTAATMTELGCTWGGRATAIGAEMAAAYAAAPGGEDYLEQRKQVRAEAARQVSAQYSEGVVAEMQSAAADVSSKASEVQAGVRAVVDPILQVELPAIQQAADLEITAKASAARELVESQAAAQTAGIQAMQASAMSSLSSQEAQAAAGIEAAGADGEQGIARARGTGLQRLAEMADGLNAEVDAGVEELEAYIAAQEIPLPENLQGLADEVLGELEEAREGAASRFSALAGELRSAFDAAAASVAGTTSQLAASAGANAATQASTTAAGMAASASAYEASMAAGVAAFTSDVQQRVTEAQTSLRSAVDGAGSQLDSQRSSLESGLASAVQSAESTLSSVVECDMRAKISEVAEREAAKIKKPSTWDKIKKVVAVVLIVVAVVAIGVLTAGIGVAIGGAIAGSLAAAGVGSALATGIGLAAGGAIGGVLGSIGTSLVTEGELPSLKEMGRDALIGLFTAGLGKGVGAIKPLSEAAEASWKVRVAVDVGESAIAGVFEETLDATMMGEEFSGMDILESVVTDGILSGVNHSPKMNEWKSTVFENDLFTRYHDGVDRAANRASEYIPNFDRLSEGDQRKVIEAMGKPFAGDFDEDENEYDLGVVEALAERPVKDVMGSGWDAARGEEEEAPEVDLEDYDFDADVDVDVNR